MHRIIWLTDLHLNFVDHEIRETLRAEVTAAAPDAILVGGDIGEAHNVVAYLRWMDAVWDVPIHVVLGNHDFYGGGISEVRSEVHRFCQNSSSMTFLTAGGLVELTTHAGLVGHDGWADAREGDYHRSLVMMNDYRLIRELAAFSKQDRLAELFRLGDEAAEHIRKYLPKALEKYERVFVLTHVPPFRKACWYQGRISDDEWAPHFVCQAMGRAILDAAAMYPNREITVLCGHTHSSGECEPAANVKVITGGAEYGHPGITRVIELLDPSEYVDPRA